jgi:hypothetical protein
MNNLKFPLPNDDLYCLIESGPLVLEKKIFLKNFGVFFLFSYFLPLGKGVPLHLNNLESPSLWIICAKSGQNWSSGSGEEVENVKVYRQTDGRTTNNRRSE